MLATTDYLALIPPEHAGRPKFVATVGLSVDPLARLTAALYALIPAFDLDAAVGAQLDAVGVRVGCGRDVPVAIENIYFSFGIANKGFGQGSWKQPFDPSVGIVQLADGDYRRLLYARVLANRFDGTAVMAQAILDTFFDDPATLVFVEDDGVVAYPRRFFAFGDPNAGFGLGEWRTQGDTGVSNLSAVDMAMKVCVSGKRPPLIYLALLSLGLIPIKPSGVRVTYLATSVDEAPLFGFGLNNVYVGGFGSGAWGVDPYDPLSPLYTTPVPVAGSLDFTISGNPLFAAI